MLGSSEVWSAEILKAWYTSAFPFSKIKVNSVTDNYLQAAKVYAIINNKKVFLQDCLVDMLLRSDTLSATVIYPRQIESNIPGTWKELFVEFPDGVCVTLPLSTHDTVINDGCTMTVDFA